MQGILAIMFVLFGAPILFFITLFIIKIASLAKGDSSVLTEMIPEKCFRKIYKQRRKHDYKDINH